MDNSDWGRNGDFAPTRWESIQEAVQVLVQGKLSLNQESAVGMLTMAGKRVELLATPCRDESRLTSTIQRVNISEYY